MLGLSEVVHEFQGCAAYSVRTTVKNFETTCSLMDTTPGAEKLGAWLPPAARKFRNLHRSLLEESSIKAVLLDLVELFLFSLVPIYNKYTQAYVWYFLSVCWIFFYLFFFMLLLFPFRLIWFVLCVFLFFFSSQDMDALWHS